MEFRVTKSFAGLLVLLCGSCTAAAGGERVQVTVLVNDRVGVAPSILSQAEDRASRMFRAAGIELAWTHCQPDAAGGDDICLRVPGANQFVLQIVADGRTSSDSVFGEAFLAEDGSGKYSDVFFRRIEDALKTMGADTAQLLGAVAAHELGHLLLGSHGHSRSGIMEPVWADSTLRELGMGKLWFTGDQSSRMRRRIGKEGLVLSAFRSRAGWVDF